MDLDQYQASLEQFIQYPDEAQVIYPIIGLAGEVGELFNKFKKVIRGDKLREEFEAALLSELGDVMWYATAICYDLGFSVDLVAPKEYLDGIDGGLLTEIEPLAGVEDLLFELLDHANSLVKLIYANDFEDFVKPLRGVLQCVHGITKHFSTSIDDICEANVNKLTARLEAGTIKGDGDNR